MKNIWKTLVSVCASAVLLFSVLLSVGVVIKNKDINSTTNNQEQTQRPSGSVSGGEIEIDQSSPYSKVYYASATAETGAAEAEAGEKGGAISMEDGTDEDIAAGKTSSMSMTGSVIQGYNAEYGGAIYVGKGCTLTLTNGTICNNTATYGGAIYVADGGTFIMNGGRIADNTSTSGGAVYVEFGGTVEFKGGVVVEGNEMSISGYTISEDTIDGFHYMEYGSYPQTYVGDTMNTTLESWYTNSSPTAVTTYYSNVESANSDDGVTFTYDYYDWPAYVYTDGNTYVRGTSQYFGYPYNYPEGTYRDGSTIKGGEGTWFKVEPIVWFVTNYGNILNGTDDSIKCLSYIGITTGGEDQVTLMRYTWEECQIKNHLNKEFLTTAFTEAEASRIKMTTIENSALNSNVDGEGVPTTQKVYLPSYAELPNIFANSNPANEMPYACSVSDFLLSNNIWQTPSVPTSYKEGSVYWALRTTSYAVTSGGGFEADGNGPGSLALRPMIELVL